MGLLDRLMAAVRGTEYVTGDLQNWLDAAADMDDNRCGAYALYEEIYNGDRGAKLRDRAREYLQQFGVPFCENFAEPVVDALAERLEVIGFQSSLAQIDPATDKAVDPVGELVEGWWQQARMDGLQTVVHTQCLIKGDEYVIVEWDNDAGRPAVIRQRTNQVRVFYSDEHPDTVEYASKLWNTAAKGPLNPNGRRVQRLNLYFPDRVEKWYRPHTGSTGTGRGGWERWRDEGDTTWPIPWVNDQGEPLGVAVVHFRNKPLGDGKGRSRVKPVIAFQEQLNKYVADLNDLVDNHALPQDYVTGITGDADLRRVPGDVWKASAVDAKFGRLAASDAKSVLDPIESVLSRLARRSRVPMHVLTGGTPPSGEALKTSESGLVATAKACQVEFGNSWEQAILLAVRLARVFGDDETKSTLAPADEDLRIETQWANPETRSDTDDLTVAEAKQRLGVSRFTLLGELGYDPEKEAKRRQAEQEASAEAQARLFDAGGLPA